MALTSEQESAVELFKYAKSLKISAFAGAGKTTTLTEIGKSTTKSGVYLAFNRSIALEAGSRFPKTVDCRTTHSLALRSLPPQFRNNQAKLFDALQGNRVAQLLNLEEIYVADVLLTPRTLGYLTARTVQRFCQSESDEITRRHVPMTGKLEKMSANDAKVFSTYVTRMARHLWGRMSDANDVAPLGHDGYLKLWSLSRPELHYDYILLDEAQDTNGAVLSVLKSQQAQLTLVGDRHQQIYAWRGAVNAMANIETEAESALTQSFRFGPEIARVANQILADLEEPLALRGNPAIQSSVATSGSARAVLCRTNVGVIEVVLNALDQYMRPYVIGGVGDLIRMLEDVTRLKSFQPADTPDLFGFQSWDEVVTFSQSEDGESLRTFVKIVNQKGEVNLIKALQSVAESESDAALVVTTGHKAKGREWASVELYSDFKPAKFSVKGSPKMVVDAEAARLLYVACTRPKQMLIVPSAMARAWAVPEAEPSVRARAKPASDPQEASARHQSTYTAPKPPKPEVPSIAKTARKSGDTRNPAHSGGGSGSADPTTTRAANSSKEQPKPHSTAQRVRPKGDAPSLMESIFKAFFGR
ncbi:UvrD-helicase domain-containing protein [Ideonella margarita]|uniref:DNA 3'-5' helicase n=1 Tax=Ideonella margarita TaxID=2984191 RepID=A0ABU9C895_9BURK